MKRKSVFGAAILILAAMISRNAHAATFDFAAVATGNEHGALSESFSDSGITVTASGRDLANQIAYYIYLDGPAGGPGGLGVCKGCSRISARISAEFARFLPK